MNVFSAALLSMCLMCAGSFACGLRRRNLTRSKIMRNFLIFGVTAMVCGLAWAEGQTSSLPNPAHDAPLAKTSTQQYGVFAGGCFWGIQAVFARHFQASKSTASHSLPVIADYCYCAAVSGCRTSRCNRRYLAVLLLGCCRFCAVPALV